MSGQEKHSLLNKLQNTKKLPFEDYDSWTWIKPLIILKSRLSGDIALKELCQERVNLANNTGNELQIQANKNVFQRILKGESLCLYLIENAK